MARVLRAPDEISHDSPAVFSLISRILSEQKTENSFTTIDGGTSIAFISSEVAEELTFRHQVEKLLQGIGADVLRRGLGASQLAPYCIVKSREIRTHGAKHLQTEMHVIRWRHVRI